MGNSVTFRLNPKHAEDRAIIEWLDANAGTEGGQTALVKAARYIFNCCCLTVLVAISYVFN